MKATESLSNGKSLLCSLFLRQSDGLFVIGTLHLLSLLSCNELDVAVRGEVGSDSTVGSVCSSSTLDSALNSEVRNHSLFDIKTLGLGISLKVLEKLDHISDRLFRESALSDTVKLGLCCSADMASESSVRNAVSMLEDIL